LQSAFGISFHHANPPVTFIAQSLLIVPMDPTAPFYQVGWTLEHEMVFYVLAALLAPFCSLIVIAGILTALGSYGLFFGEHPWLYHLTSEYQIYFAAGVLLFAWRDHASKIGAVGPMAASILILAYIINIQANSTVVFLGFGAASVLVCVGLLNLRAPEVGLASWFWRSLVSLGNVSFSIYIVHWAVFRVAWFMRGTYLIQDHDAELVRWTGIIATIPLSYMVYWLIEEPSNRLGHRVAALFSRRQEPIERLSRLPTPPV